MLSHHYLTPLTPAELAEERQACYALVHDYPWLIPVTVAAGAFPAVVAAHGFWKNRQLKKQLQIEREKTKQLTLQAKAPTKRLGGHH
ncbi:hypothetical protein [Levilactobacillus zymae]|uniref:Transposase n=1 Tax=Levilactobacillus zymae TaxID=267363 RepID=A0A1Y6K308_9LACO|nr:hypothetical protein [Levilactobacillus zymae]KRL16354.1 hypothetical protein FD38_GL000199 [Levilactobacillus zymae DSM 19395]QFR61946.1 transposase [Levilactobacillus zymae]GEO72631.1 hypothetical protein LZY01_17990 [Levilactobacillus zymae]SMS15483.1 Transposase [Levilactobacillus zymae]